MCLLALAWRCHPRYKLVLVANRDEFHQRPTALADWWQDEPSLLGGRDREAGGSWLAVNRTGRIALVTNYRESLQRSDYPVSRGALVASFAAGNAEPGGFADELAPAIGDYAGFNLLVCNRERLLYLCNRGEYRRELGPGIYALSNGRLDTPWPKVEITRDRFSAAIASDDVDIEALLSVVADSTPFGDNALPDTGIGYERERLLSAPFVISPTYGTRCSTAVLWSENDRVEFVERSFEPSGLAFANRRFEFAVEPGDDA